MRSSRRSPLCAPAPLLLAAALAWILCCPALPASALDFSAADRAGLEALYGADACFTLYDESRAAWTRINAPRCAVRYTPCSTFKVAHALIALETGVVPVGKDGAPDLTLEWDSERDPASPGWPAEWRQSNDLASAVRYSVIWFFQELARRIGPQREQAWLDRLEYGNRDISGGLEGFWLTSSLKISADEQARFLRRMFSHDLPVSPCNSLLVRGLILRERGETDALWGKTGTGLRPLENGRHIALFVGAAEKDGHRYFFALNCEDGSAGKAAARRGRLLQSTLAALGLDG